MQLRYVNNLDADFYKTRIANLISQLPNRSLAFVQIPSELDVMDLHPMQDNSDVKFVYDAERVIFHEVKVTNTPSDTDNSNTQQEPTPVNQLYQALLNTTNHTLFNPRLYYPETISNVYNQTNYFVVIKQHNNESINYIGTELSPFILGIIGAFLAKQQFSIQNLYTLTFEQDFDQKLKQFITKFQTSFYRANLLEQLDNPCHSICLAALKNATNEQSYQLAREHEYFHNKLLQALVKNDEQLSYFASRCLQHTAENLGFALAQSLARTSLTDNNLEQLGQQILHAYYKYYPIHQVATQPQLQPTAPAQTLQFTAPPAKTHHTQTTLAHQATFTANSTKSQQAQISPSDLKPDQATAGINFDYGYYTERERQLERKVDAYIKAHNQRFLLNTEVLAIKTNYYQLRYQLQLTSYQLDTYQDFASYQAPRIHTSTIRDASHDPVTNCDLTKHYLVCHVSAAPTGYQASCTRCLLLAPGQSLTLYPDNTYQDTSNQRQRGKTTLKNQDHLIRDTVDHPRNPSSLLTNDLPYNFELIAHYRLLASLHQNFITSLRPQVTVAHALLSTLLTTLQQLTAQETTAATTTSHPEQNSPQSEMIQTSHSSSQAFLKQLTKLLTPITATEQAVGYFAQFVTKKNNKHLAALQATQQQLADSSSPYHELITHSLQHLRQHHALTNHDTVILANKQQDLGLSLTCGDYRLSIQPVSLHQPQFGCHSSFKSDQGYVLTCMHMPSNLQLQDTILIQDDIVLRKNLTANVPYELDQVLQLWLQHKL